MKWIDVSAHNGHIDWSQVATSGVKGVIIRAGYGDDISQKDTHFEENIKGAIAAGLKVAVYWFSYADSADDALKEWEVCKQIIEPYRKNIRFVASDYEYDSRNYYLKVHKALPSNDLVNQMVNAFLSAAKADGYGTALYTNNDYRKNIFSSATLAAWSVWLADYTGSPDISCMMQQTGSSGIVPGISGNVDIDECYMNFSTCDTAGTVEIAMGNCYTAKTTGDVQLVPGKSDTSARVQIVRCLQNGYTLWHIIPLGDSGQDVGIYGGGELLFKVHIA